MLQTHRLEPCWAGKKSKFTPNVRRKSRNTNSRLIMTNEVYENSIESQQEELQCAQAEELQRRAQLLFMKGYCSNNSELREAHHKALHSTLFRGENWSRIRTLFWNLLARYKNCKTKLIVWTIRGIFRMLNQYAVKCPRFQSTRVIPTSSNSWRNAKPFCRNAELQRRPAKRLGQRYIEKRFCKSGCVFFSILSEGIESIEIQNRRAASFIQWKRVRGEHKMKIRDASPDSQSKIHLQWRRLSKWGRPTTTADFWSSFWQVPDTSHVCLLEDKIQDWGMYLFTISHGRYALFQRSGNGWFCGWFKNLRYL